MRASLTGALREYNGHAALENPLGDLYEAKPQRDCGRCDVQISSFIFAEVYLHGCGNAPALRSGQKRGSSENSTGEPLRWSI